MAADLSIHVLPEPYTEEDVRYFHAVHRIDDKKYLEIRNAFAEGPSFCLGEGDFEELSELIGYGVTLLTEHVKGELIPLVFPSIQK